MKNAVNLTRGGILLALLAWTTACVIAPREGYYDRDHHRYYHDHEWHDCRDHDEFCR
jgi:hypothetical protein